MKTSIRFLTLIALLFMTPMSSCKKDPGITAFSGYSYFPLTIGHQVIYEVDSIVKSEFNLGKIDTFTFQIKEMVESFFIDNEGRETARIERYKRANASEPWVIHKVWTANLNLMNAEKKEDNLTFIKLAFPPKKDQKWNGNAKNELDEQEYKITDVNIPESVNGIAFDSVLTVLQADEDNIVYKKYEIEKYAARTGMVYKEQFNGTYKYIAGIYTLAGFTHYTEKVIPF